MSFTIGNQNFKSTEGQLRTINTVLLDEIRAGNIEDHEFVTIRAHCHSVGTVDQEISALGIARTTTPFGNWPTAAAGVILVSDDAADAAAGTGARSVIIRGLDSNWATVTETIIPTGLTPTTVTAQTFIRINEIEVVTCGAELTNLGTITVSISGVDIMAIYPIHTTSDAGRWTVEAGKILSLENAEASAVAGKELTYHIFARDASIADTPFLLKGSWHSKDGGYRPNGKMEPFPEKTDVIFIAHAELGGGSCSASVIGYEEIAP